MPETVSLVPWADAPPIHHRIAVLVPMDRVDDETIAHACALAETHRARLLLIGIVPRPWPTTGLGGVCPVNLMKENVESGAARMREVVSALPDGICCTTVLRVGNRRRQLRRALTELGADALCLSTRDRSRWLLHGLIGHETPRRRARSAPAGRLGLRTLLSSPSPAPKGHR